MKEEDRFATDDVTWCWPLFGCKIDCPRQPQYIRDKTVPHSYSDFSQYCPAYVPKYSKDERSE